VVGSSPTSHSAIVTPYPLMYLDVEDEARRMLPGRLRSLQNLRPGFDGAQARLKEKLGGAAQGKRPVSSHNRSALDTKALKIRGRAQPTRPR